MPGKRFVIVVFDGIPFGALSFGFGVFELGMSFGALPGLEVSVVSGEPEATLRGGGLVCPVPYDLDAVRQADVGYYPRFGGNTLRDHG
jgi:hypothetical protein